MTVRVVHGDMLAELPKLAAEGFRAHAVVTDPPYELGFMGKSWDASGVAFQPETWRAVYDALKPGAHLLAFGGTRTFHRMACAIEDAGFEIRDTIMWVYGSGFPKSLDVSKAIDKAAGVERTEVVGTKLGRPRMARDGGNQRSGFNAAFGGVASGGLSTDITAPATLEAAAWSGWGTALKPAWEPIIVARKPLDGTVAANTLKHSCGVLNIEASRVPGEPWTFTHSDKTSRSAGIMGETSGARSGVAASHASGRWPANVIHDGSDEVEAAFAAFGERAVGNPNRIGGGVGGIWCDGDKAPCGPSYADSGTASRFFFCAKADAADRAGSKHPTIKPTALMRWLVQLVTPPGGTILDPFAGSGSTGLAADQLGFNAVLIEREAQYAADARRKIAADAPLLGSVA